MMLLMILNPRPVEFRRRRFGKNRCFNLMSNLHRDPHIGTHVNIEMNLSKARACSWLGDVTNWIVRFRDEEISRSSFMIDSDLR